MPQPLRIAVIGTGFFSQFHFNAWQRLADAGSVELVGVCSLDRDAAAAVQQRYAIADVFDSVPEMLSGANPDLLDIVTPPPTHVEFVTLAVQAGIPAICQKPFTPSLAEAENLVDTVAADDGRVFVHENFRFQPWFRKIGELLKEGVVGTPYEAMFWLRPGDGQGDDAYLARQPYFQQMPRFLVHETAIHLIDTFRFLFGEIADVYAQLDRLNPVIAGEDAGIVLFNFENGVRGVFDGNRLADHAADNHRLTMGEMRIEGSGGTLRLDGFGRIFVRAFGTNDETEVSYDWSDIDYAGDCVHATIKHVVDHLQTGSAVANTASDYLVNLRIEEAVYRSAASHARERISPD